MYHIVLYCILCIEALNNTQYIDCTMHLTPYSTISQHTTHHPSRPFFFLTKEYYGPDRDTGYSTIIPCIQEYWKYYHIQIASNLPSILG